MERMVTKEELLDLFLHGNAQDIQDSIDTIHPVDILDLLYEHREEAQHI